MPAPTGPLKAGIGALNAGIDDAARARILSRLQDVACQEGVDILLAVESGSRAWGFPSPDSDYDVRFIYAHPRDWYVSLTEKRDVIERPINDDLIDLAGWDLRKALRLLLRSNPALYEWLVSPVTYLAQGPFRTQAKTLFERHADPNALAHHYHSIADGQWRRAIEGRSQVRLKKYFYVIRPLLSLSWVADNHAAPPMQLGDLLAQTEVPADVREAIAGLLILKAETPELGAGDRLTTIDDWIETSLARMNPAILSLPDRPKHDGTEHADVLFRSLIDRN